MQAFFYLIFSKKCRKHKKQTHKIWRTRFRMWKPFCEFHEIVKTQFCEFTFKVRLRKYTKWHESICCNCDPLKKSLTVHDRKSYFWRNIFPNWRKFNIIRTNGEHPNERILKKIHICWKTIENLFSKTHCRDDIETFWLNSNIHSKISIRFREILRIWNLHLHCWFEI